MPMVNITLTTPERNAHMIAEKNKVMAVIRDWPSVSFGD